MDSISINHAIANLGKVIKQGSQTGHIKYIFSLAPTIKTTSDLIQLFLVAHMLKKSI